MQLNTPIGHQHTHTHTHTQQTGHVTKHNDGTSTRTQQTGHVTKHTDRTSTHTQWTVTKHIDRTSRHTLCATGRYYLVLNFAGFCHPLSTRSTACQLLLPLNSIQKTTSQKSSWMKKQSTDITLDTFPGTYPIQKTWHIPRDMPHLKKNMMYSWGHTLFKKTWCIPRDIPHSKKMTQICNNIARFYYFFNGAGTSDNWVSDPRRQFYVQCIDTRQMCRRLFSLLFNTQLSPQMRWQRPWH